MNTSYSLVLTVILAVGINSNVFAEGASNSPASGYAGVKRERADDERMSDDAMAPHVGSAKKPDKRQTRIQALHDRVNENARLFPNAESSATLVFRTGLTTTKLLDLAETYELEIMSVDVKAPLNDVGVIQSIKVGALDIMKWDGDFETQLAKAIGAFRYDFVKKAEAIEKIYGGETDESIAYRSVAMSRMQIYRSEVFGKLSKIRDAMAESMVGLVAPDDLAVADRKIDSYKSLKHETERRRSSRAARQE